MQKQLSQRGNRTIKRGACGRPWTLRVAAVVAVGILALPGPLRQTFGAWQSHEISQGDGHGGLVSHPAQRQTLSVAGATRTFPMGLVQMGNGRIALVASAWSSGSSEYPAISISNDAGNSWSAFQSLPTTPGVSYRRPLMLTYLGGGNLSYVSAQRRYFSHDYGETWPESTVVPLTTTGDLFDSEGNAGVDRDAAGNATRVMEIGWHYDPGKSWPASDCSSVFRYSLDGGRTWQGEVEPANWKFVSTYNGQDYVRGTSEGSIVRAADGSLVAALRTDMPPRFYANGGAYGGYDDSLEGLGISISKDNGQSWSPVNPLFDAGRHHANLQRLSNGDLVCTMIVRDDIRSGEGLDTHMRGCDAILSHDNGLTWDLDRRITLDEFEYYNPNQWYNGMTGHLGTTVLADGSMLTAYGNYLDGTAEMVKWNPVALPEPGVWLMLFTGVCALAAHAWRRRR
jgi:hypothetical protein